ncbi:MAG: hypothetical protein QOI05_3013 [Bradyrhizobium sp.]|jgi:hypothetical protein|nr:hypothetical protein [Bradyrhizobium sp.]
MFRTLVSGAAAAAILLALVSASSPAKMNLSGTQNLSIGLANQPLGLAVGVENGTPAYVRVVTNSGNLPQWQFKTLGSDGVTAKLHIGTADGQFWWAIPGNSQLPNAVGLAPGENLASTIILNIGANTLEASFGPGGFLAPTGGPSGFYFATNNNASAQLNFFATE